METGARRIGPRRICFATTIADSSESFMNPVAGALANLGHRIELIAGDRPPEAAYPHTSTILPMTRGMSPLTDGVALSSWVSHLRATRPDMLVVGTPKASLLGSAAALIAGVPTRVYAILGAVWDGATGTRRRLLESAERATIASSTHQISVSDSLARLIHARGLSGRMPVVLGSGSICGVDLDHYVPPDLPPDPARRELVFVGRLNRDKGIDVLLRTLDRVRQHAHTSLTIVGRLDTTAPPAPPVISAVRSHPHVNWVTDADDIVPYLQRASILLFPTAREGLSQVTLEAQACGVPVVSWRVTGVLDAVRDGFTGILVPFGDEEALAHAALGLLADADLRARMSANAREFVKREFAQRTVVAAYRDYLEMLLLTRSRSHD